MATRTASVWVVFNGEIYNFADVRAELDAARPSLPDALRHRGHRPRLRAVGRALRRALPRHVRVRHLGRDRAAAAAGARSARRQAALLRASSRAGSSSAPRSSRCSRIRRSARVAARCARRVSDAALRSGARHHLPRDPQAAAGARPGRRAAVDSHVAATGISSSPATATPPREEDYLERARRPAARSGRSCA